MATDTPNRRRRRNTSESTSTSNPTDHWDYFVTIKWLIVGLIISMGCVYSFDLLWTVASSYIKNGEEQCSNNNIDKKNANHCNSINGNNDKAMLFPWRSKKADDDNDEITEELHVWLEDNDLLQFTEYFESIGMSTFSCYFVLKIF